MTVRTDAQLKATFTALCEEFGMNTNTAMNIFMRAVAETKSIPFTIGKREESERDRLYRLMAENRMANANRPEMTMDEINAEIAAARAERRDRLSKDAADL